MNLILALDIGTTGTKAALIDREGQFIGIGYADYLTYHGAGNVVEQEPADWWRATCAALAQVWQSAPADAAQQVAMVSLSGQMQDLILLGADGAIGRALLYSDCRAQEEAAFVNALIGRTTLEQITGNEQGAASLLAKWLWLQKNAPVQLAACRKILVGAHEYIGWHLHGGAGADYTTAATTGLLDLAQNQWSYALLIRLGLDADKLPGLCAATEIGGEVTADASAVTGIPVGTPVLRGAGDLAATTIGVGAGEPGRLYAYLGTSGWLASSLARATPNVQSGIFTLRHPAPQRYIQVAPMLTAGGNLDWFRTQAASYQLPVTSYDWINEQVVTVPVGSRGLIYLPYLAGERSPFSDPQARGAFIGLSLLTTQAEQARAVMEGVAFAYRNLRDSLQVAQTGPLFLVGGGAKSTIWPQIMADVLGCEVQIVAAPGDAAVRGAAILAGIRLGWYTGYAPHAHFFPIVNTYTPYAENVQQYEAIYRIFRSLYPQLRRAFADLARIQAGL
ncbi:MAG: FGGY-family carbohydrate kinase [Chloroflexi bacterium]|nr:FGGY-family carbohydrate kinase [Chloroflexota bacterium]